MVFGRLTRAFRPSQREPLQPQTALDIGARLQEAIVHHQHGELARAEALYRELLVLAPANFDVLHLLGVVQHQQGRHESAVDFIRRAIEADPSQAAAHSNLGLALRQLKRHEEALDSYDRALALAPDFAEALCNRGNVLFELKRHDDSLASYERALALRPDDWSALFGCGNTLLELQRHRDALASYDRALALKPDHAEALNNRGNALQSLGWHDEALASYERALAVKPDHVEALINRGNVLLELNRHVDALDCYDRALVLDPDNALALYDRGNALLALKRADEAVACYDRALALEPGRAEALNNRGNALRELNWRDEALASYDRALGLVPDYPDALLNRGIVLEDLNRLEDALASYDRALTVRPEFAEVLNNRGIVLGSLGRHEEATKDFERALNLKPDLAFLRGSLLHSRMHCCDWRGYEDESRRLVDDVRLGRHGAAPLVLFGVSDSADDQLRCAQTWVGYKHPPSPTPIWRGERYDHGRIRIAYLSSDFRGHAVANQIAELFERHDRERFAVTAVAFGPDSADGMRSRLQAAVERFVDVSHVKDRDVAELLRDWEIDVAIDLNGFTAHARTGVFALRPAPVQVNYLGYPGTMGAAYIDYIIADRVVIPPAHQAHYAEKVVYLPDTYMVNDSGRRSSEQVPSRGEVGLPHGGFVFCAFNNSYKITPQMFDVWLRLLRGIDGSVLWLRQSNETASNNLRRRAAESNVDPDRLVFAAKTASMGDYLALYRLADLFLDTLPYNAHSTACDALGAGLPVLTCMGGAFAGRVAGSLLHAIGLPELVTHSLAEYETLARKLAADSTLLAGVKQKLARNRDTFPLFDTDRFRRHIEAAYLSMWERHRRGEAPASFDVAALA